MRYHYKAEILLITEGCPVKFKAGVDIAEIHAVLSCKAWVPQASSFKREKI